MVLSSMNAHCAICLLYKNYFNDVVVILRHNILNPFKIWDIVYICIVGLHYKYAYGVTLTSVIFSGLVILLADITWFYCVYILYASTNISK